MPESTKQPFKYRPHVMVEGEVFPRGSWCLHCGAHDDEPAKPKCKNPWWHTAPKPEEDGPF